MSRMRIIGWKLLCVERIYARLKMKWAVEGLASAENPLTGRIWKSVKTPQVLYITQSLLVEQLLEHTVSHNKKLSILSTTIRKQMPKQSETWIGSPNNVFFFINENKKPLELETSYKALIFLCLNSTVVVPVNSILRMKVSTTPIFREFKETRKNYTFAPLVLSIDNTDQWLRQIKEGVCPKGVNRTKSSVNIVFIDKWADINGEVAKIIKQSHSNECNFYTHFVLERHYLKFRKNRTLLCYEW